MTVGDKRLLSMHSVCGHNTQKGDFRRVLLEQLFMHFAPEPNCQEIVVDTSHNFVVAYCIPRLLLPLGVELCNQYSARLKGGPQVW